jgi:hypothetical protein
MSYSKMKRRFNGCNTTVFEELINEGCIKVVDVDVVRINFLDEQWSERKKLSETNSKNVSKRWENKVSDTTVLQPNNDGNEFVYNIEENREEDKRIEENKKEKIPLRAVVENPFPLESPVSKAWSEWEQHRKEKKQKLTPSTIKKQIKFLGGRADPEIIEIINRSITNGWTGLFELPNNNNNGNRAATKRKSDAVITGGSAFGTFD